jgi:peptide/nickel transport system permease protein
MARTSRAPVVNDPVWKYVPAKPPIDRYSWRTESWSWRGVIGSIMSLSIRPFDRLVAYVPQEPMSNLDPAFRIGKQLQYGLRAVTGMSKAKAESRVLELLDRVGLPEPRRTFNAYPHEISGGMAQRALIAGAVACEPKLLIADEPTTALDVTVQAEILELLRDLQGEHDMGILLVTHNFGVVADICDRVAVMQNGAIVEEGTVEEIFSAAKHHYTRSLLDAILSEEAVRPKLAADSSVLGRDAS